MKEIVSHSLHETQKAGADFAKSLVGAAPLGAQQAAPLLIGLKGDLGAGKTTFVQGMARGLGISSNYYVSSPTFTLVNDYGCLIHVDLYRLEKSEEAYFLGLEDYFLPGNIIVIEWIEKNPDLEKKLDYEVTLKAISENERQIVIQHLSNNERALTESDSFGSDKRSAGQNDKS